MGDDHTAAADEEAFVDAAELPFVDAPSPGEAIPPVLTPEGRSAPSSVANSVLPVSPSREAATNEGSRTGRVDDDVISSDAVLTAGDSTDGAGSVDLEASLPSLSQDATSQALDFLREITHSRPHKLTVFMCPFSLCRGRRCRHSQALQLDVQQDILRSREQCLAGTHLAALVSYLQADTRWFSIRCSKIHTRSRSCPCGHFFDGVSEIPIHVAEGHPLPLATPEIAATQVAATPDAPQASSAETPAIVDPAIFVRLRQTCCPTISFVPKRCRSLRAEAIVHAVNRTVASFKSDTSRGLLKFEVANAFNCLTKRRFAEVRW